MTGPTWSDPSIHNEAKSTATISSTHYRSHLHTYHIKILKFATLKWQNYSQTLGDQKGYFRHLKITCPLKSPSDHPRVRVFPCTLSYKVFRHKTLRFSLFDNLNHKSVGFERWLFVKFWAFAPVVVQIHDHLHPMDQSPGQTTPPIEEDEWGMIFFSFFSTHVCLFLRKSRKRNNFGSLRGSK